jgi:hypothetical protein
MRSLQLANFAIACNTVVCNTSRDTTAKADLATNARRPKAMLSGWRLDAADDPTILFSSLPDRLQVGRNSVAEARETDERLWARHQAWDM